MYETEQNIGTINKKNKCLDPSGENTRRRTGNGTIELAVRHKPGVGFVQPSRPAGIEGIEISFTNF